MTSVLKFLMVTTPVLIPSLGGTLLILFATNGSRNRFSKNVSLGVFVFTAAAAALFSLSWLLDVPVSTNPEPWYKEFLKHYFVDNFSFAWTFTVDIFVLLSGIFLKDEFEKSDVLNEMLGLLLFATSGAAILISASSLLMVFVGLEFLSLPVYVLVASRRGDAASCEAGLKYFLFGSFASVILLLSIAILYASTGSIYFSAIERQLPGLDTNTLILGVGLFMVATGFKVGLAPFHMWVPDAYQGAPSSITGFMGSALKLAGFAMALRLFWGPFIPQSQRWSFTLEWLALAGMLVGSLGGLVQKNLKRLLAYSSITHAGYLALGLAVVPKSLDSVTLWYYLTTYGIMFIGLFGAIGMIERARGRSDIDALAGVGFSQPLVGVVISIFVLSAAGIPPLAGFVAKYFLFLEVVKTGHTASVVFAVISSLVSMYYYLRIIVVLYMKEGERGAAFTPAKMAYSAAVLCAALIVYLGIFPTIFR